jgi:hypothetical protein
MTLPDLSYFNHGFNPQISMWGSELHSVGYHTTLPDGTWVHHTRESLVYAILLLQSGVESNAGRSLFTGASPCPGVSKRLDLR